MYMLQVNKTTHYSYEWTVLGDEMKPGDEESINRNCKPCNVNGCNVRVNIT